MIATIGELKEKGTFIAEEWYNVTIGPEGRSGGKKDCEYIFRYDSTKEKLYISGDVFGTEEYEVLNKDEVLFHAAKGYSLDVKIEGISIRIWNTIIRFPEAT